MSRHTRTRSLRDAAAAAVRGARADAQPHWVALRARSVGLVSK